MPKKKKPGRPPTKGGRDPIRSIRVPDHEWQRWKDEANDLDISIAQLIRLRMTNPSHAEGEPKGDAAAGSDGGNGGKDGEDQGDGRVGFEPGSTNWGSIDEM